MTSKVGLICRFIHAWGGISLALFFLLATMSGTLLLWKQDYVLLSLAGNGVLFEDSPETLAQLAERVEAQFDNNEILQLSFPSRQFPLAKLALSEQRYAYLDPAGNVLASWQLNERWEEWLYDLHHRFLLGDPGLTLMGVLALALLVLVLAGLVAFWPLRRQFRQGFWPQGLQRSRLLVSHRNLGVLLGLPLIFILLTAALLAFPEEAEEYLLEPFRGDDYSLDFADGVDDIIGNDSGDWLPALQRSLQSFPGASLRMVEFPNNFSPYRVIGLQQTGELNPLGMSLVYIDASTGRMELRIDSQQQHLSERLYNMAYPLHTGRVDNILYRILLTVTGLLASVLSLLAVISFSKKYFHQEFYE